jgi:hypothetical protein
MSSLIRRVLFLVIALAPALSACEHIPTEVKEVAGEYQLIAINGVPLPVAIITGNGPAQIFEGRLRLQRDGAYLQVIHYSFDGSASAPQDVGRYEVRKGNLRFDSADYATYAGTVGDGTVTTTFLLPSAQAPQAATLTFSRI